MPCMLICPYNIQTMCHNSNISNINLIRLQKGSGGTTIYKLLVWFSISKANENSDWHNFTISMSEVLKSFMKHPFMTKSGDFRSFWLTEKILSNSKTGRYLLLTSCNTTSSVATRPTFPKIASIARWKPKNSAYGHFYTYIITLQVRREVTKYHGRPNRVTCTGCRQCNELSVTKPTSHRPTQQNCRVSNCLEPTTVCRNLTKSEQ